MANKVHIGILGCANIAQRLVIPSILQCDEFVLTAVASRNASKANTWAEKFNCEAETDYDALINRSDIDAIYMPLPIGLHHEWGIKCLQSGKHLLSEKSLTTDLKSASEMVDEARKAGKVLQENFMFAHHSQHNFVKAQIEAGTIGELRRFSCSFGFPPFSDKDNIRYQAKLGGGALLDAGAYTVKVAQIFLGDSTQVIGSNMYFDNDFGVDITGSALLKNDRGVTALASWGFDNFYQCNYEIWGSKGKITVDRAYTAPPGFKPKITIQTQDNIQEINVAADNHFIKILKHFYTCIQKDEREPLYKELINQAALMQKINSNGSN